MTWQSRNLNCDCERPGGAWQSLKKKFMIIILMRLPRFARNDINILEIDTFLSVNRNDINHGISENTLLKEG